MVRTRSSGVKAGGKASRKTAPAASVASSSSGAKKSENGNPVQVQPTPAWQREITGFLGNPSKKPRLEDDDSNSSTKESAVGEKPAVGDKTDDNKVLDDSVNGGNSSKESKNSSEKEEKEEDSKSAGQTEKGSVESANGCKKLDKDSAVVNKDVSSKKDSKKIEKN